MPGRIIPAYTYHTQLADRIAAETLNSADRVILNPSNGPSPDNGLEMDNVRTVATALGKLRAYGYIHLDQGNRPWRAVYKDARDWIKYYGVDNFMFDDCPPNLGRGELTALTGVSRRTILNPGVPWTGTQNIGFNTIVITREDSGPLAYPPTSRIPASQQAAIAYNTDIKAADLQSLGYGFAYATKDDRPNPYDGVSNG